MSTSIEQKVVEMRFDNKQFESATSQSMSTIDKLKQKLNFTGATKGLENINSSVKKVDMTPIGKAVETVQTKFSALQVVGVTALMNITNTAINAGKRMISALTIDPISTGLDEYELKMNSIQTIMANTASKGTTMMDVTAALDELNTYADKTIYNFAEMTRNIGTFTAAGVDLDKSVTSIKGIANLAAISGSSSMQASTAMYQLSQALAAGKVSLMDWNSVVNAGMGGEVFQNALKRTATQMGINVDMMIEKYGSFRESLTEGAWLTADVLTETLTQLSGAYTEADLIAQGYSEQQAKEIVELANTAVDAATKVKTFTQLFDTMKESVQSGWAQSWEIIIGDFEEARDSLTNISDIVGEYISKTSDARNKFLSKGLTSSWKQISEEVRATGIDLEDFQNKLIATGKEHGVVTDEMIQKAGGFEKSLKTGWATVDIFTEVLREYSSGMSSATQTTEEMNSKLEYFQNVVNQVWNGDFRNGKERIDALTKAGYDYATVQDLVNKTVDGHKLTLEDLNVEQAANLGFTKEQIMVLNDLADQAEKTGEPLNKLITDLTRPSGRELLLGSLTNIITAALKPLSAFKEAWNEIFFSNPERLYNLAAGLNEFTSKLILSDESAENLKWTFKGLFSIVDLITTVLSGGLKIVVNALVDALGLGNIGILTITGSIGKAIVAFRDFILENNIIVSTIGKFVEIIVIVGKAIAEFVKYVYQLPGVQNGLKKLSETFNNFGNVIEKFFSDGASKIQPFIDKLKTMDDFSLDDFYNLLSEFRSNVLSSFGNFKNSFVDISKNIIQGLVNGIKNNAPKVENAIRYITEILINTIKNLLGIHSPSIYFTEIGGYIIQGLVNGIKNGANLVTDVIKYIIDSITKVTQSVDWGKVFALTGTIAMGVFAKKTLDILDRLTAPFESISNLIDSVSGVVENVSNVLNSFSKVLKGFAFKMQADAIKSLAISIAILVGTVVTLTLIDPEKLWNAVAVLSAIIGVFTIMIGVVQILAILSSKFGANTVKFTALSASLIGLAASVLIISKAAKLIGDMEPERAKQAFHALGGILIGISIVVGLFGIFVRGQNAINIAKFGFMMIELAVALGLLTIVIKQIGKLENDDLSKGAKVLGAFVGIIALISLINKFLAVSGVDSLAINMLKLSLSFGLMILIVKNINGISKDEIETARIAIIGFLGFMWAVMRMNNMVGGFNSGNLGSTMIGISISLLILIGVIKLIGFLNPSDILKGMGVITIFGVFLILLAKSINSIQGEIPKISGTLLALSISLGILSAVCIALSLIDMAGLTKGLVVIGLLSLFISGLLKATKGATDVKGTLLGISIAIGVLAASIVILSFIDPKDLIGPTIALSMILGMFSLVLKAAGTINGAMGTIITLTVAITLLSIALGLLSMLPVESLLASSASLSILLLSFSVSLKILSSMNTLSPMALAAIGVMLIVFAGLAGILYLLKDIPAENAMKNVTNITTMLMGMTVALGVLTLIGLGGPAALIGIGSLAALIIGIGGLMVAIGALSTYYPDLESFLTKGMKLLEQIGIGIGSFFGSIISGFVESASSSLPILGMNLSMFMANVLPFIYGAKQINSKTFDGVKSLAETILILTGADILNSLTSWMTGGSSLSSFAEDLVPFGKAMTEFSKSLVGMDSNLVINASKAGKTLAEMASTIPNSGGLVSFFTGENDFKDFTNKLVPFGKAIKEYSLSVQGTDTEAIINSTKAGKSLTDLANSIPNSGGLLSKFSGENDITDFSKGLVPFGKAIKEYSLSVQGLDISSIENSTKAGKSLTDLANSIPNSGGLIEYFTGGNDMGIFGDQISKFGKAIKDYSISVIGLDNVAIENSVNVGKSLMELSNTLPNTGGLVAFFTGENNLSVFGEQLSNFGTSIKMFSDSVVGINMENINLVITTMNSFSKFQNGISDDGLKKINTFGTYIITFGDQFNRFSKNISEVDFYKITGFTNVISDIVTTLSNSNSINSNAISNLNKALSDLSKISIDKFVNTINKSKTKVTSSFSEMLGSITRIVRNNSGSISSSFIDMLSKIINIFDKYNNKFIKVGDDIVLSIANGIKYKKNTPSEYISDVLISITKSIEISYNDFKKASSYIIDGIVDGIKNNKHKAIYEINILATQLETAMKNALDINSPSRVFYTIGDFVVQGLNKGIKDYIPFAKKTTEQLGNSIIKSFQETLGIHSPSVVMNKQGHYIVQGIAEGITEDMSAEEAAAQKAKNIADAFQKEFDRIELNFKTKDLAYQLWEKMNPEATESTKTDTKLSFLKDKMDSYKETLIYTQAEYQETVRTFGEKSNESKKAYQEFLQAQIDLASVVEEYNKIINDYNEKSANAYEENISKIDRYSEVYNKIKDQMLERGYSLEEITKMASEVSGFDLTMTKDIKREKLDVKNVIDEVLGKITKKSTESIKGTLIEKTKEIGNNAGNSITKTMTYGIQNGTPEVVNAASTMVSICAEKIKKQNSVWASAALFLVDTYINTIENNIQKAADKAANMAVLAYNAAMSVLRGTDMSVPVITPVLDLSDVNSGLKSINASYSAGIVSGIRNRSYEQKSYNNDNDKKSMGATYQFTQNNYSPKALSKSEIYRQTKNQFSSLKGMIDS